MGVEKEKLERCEEEGWGRVFLRNFWVSLDDKDGGKPTMCVDGWGKIFFFKGMSSSILLRCLRKEQIFLNYLQKIVKMSFFEDNISLQHTGL